MLKAAKLILRCLQKDPERRFQSCADLMSAATVCGLPCLLVFVVLQRNLTGTIGLTRWGR